MIFNYIKDQKYKEVFLFMSDSRGGPNLNQFFSTALLHAVRVTKCKLIDHVFYEPGHSQQEGDAMHSTSNGDKKIFKSTHHQNGV